MSDLIEIAKLVKERRKERGWSQHELAARAGVSRARIADLEREQLPDIGFNTLSRILRALGHELRAAPSEHRRPTFEELLKDRD